MANHVSGMAFSSPFVRINVTEAGRGPYGTLNPGPSATSFGAGGSFYGASVRDEGKEFPGNTVDAPAMAPAVVSGLAYTPPEGVTSTISHRKGAIVVLDNSKEGSERQKHVYLSCSATASNEEIKISNLRENALVLGVLAETVIATPKVPVHIPVAVKGVTEVWCKNDIERKFYAGQRVVITASDGMMLPSDFRLVQNNAFGKRKTHLTGVVIVPPARVKSGDGFALVHID